MEAPTTKHPTGRPRVLPGSAAGATPTPTLGNNIAMPTRPQNPPEWLGWGRLPANNRHPPPSPGVSTAPTTLNTLVPTVSRTRRCRATPGLLQTNTNWCSPNWYDSASLGGGHGKTGQLLGGRGRPRPAKPILLARSRTAERRLRDNPTEQAGRRECPPRSCSCSVDRGTCPCSSLPAPDAFLFPSPRLKTRLFSAPTKGRFDVTGR